MLSGICIRTVAPTDSSALGAFYECLGPDTRYRRFHGLTHLSNEAAVTFAGADGQCRAGYVATQDGRIVGHACLEPVGPGRAELGIAVADELAGHGIGRALLSALEAWGRSHGIRHICASVLTTNGSMIALMRHIGPVQT